jgi:hypothetical protein
VDNVNGQATLQIAETRFAIKCDYQPFMEWLHDACGDFLVEGEPHARIKLDIEVSVEYSGEPRFRFKPRYLDEEQHFKITWLTLNEPDMMFRAILDKCLNYCILSKQTSDLRVHASGVIYQDHAYIFTGPSGTGKSTVSHILANQPGFTVLHDEMVPLSQVGPCFYAWSSPLRGERPSRNRLGAPLSAIFFLNQADSNSCVRLSARKVFANLGQTIKATDIILNNDQVFLSNVLLTIVERVPGYELYFRPDFSFWNCIEQALLIEKPALNARKG